jgi:ElaA protein
VSDAAAARDVEWRWARFDALTPAELYAITQARIGVFIVEQACPYQDADGADPDCFHLWTLAGGDGVAAYLRVVPPGVKYAEPSIGRILTTGVGRGTGLGRALVAEGIRRVESLYGPSPIRIGAQRYLLRFYESFGFARTGYDYDEDGIPHSEMLRERGTRS